MDYTNSTLVINFKHTGEDIMVFSSGPITHDKIQRALDFGLHHYDEIIEVSQKDIQYHLYEPYWLDPEAEAHILSMYNKKIHRL